EVSTVPDHLTINVTLDRRYLVDVGFGDSFIRPLPLDSTGPHDGGVGEFGFVLNGDETTLIAYKSDGDGEPQYRFDSNTYETSDFDNPSQRLQTDPSLHWTKSPFATRLLDGGPDRVTLLRDQLKFRRDGIWVEEPVTEEAWPIVLDQWFGMTP
ncbi:MAG: arylamine N-acetyltransferase, partial [Acidobacteria bacterium]|nr:arylamine N-acetyltransferase [Acidobacteriota bacterium]